MKKKIIDIILVLLLLSCVALAIAFNDPLIDNVYKRSEGEHNYYIVVVQGINVKIEYVDDWVDGAYLKFCEGNYSITTLSGKNAINEKLERSKTYIIRANDKKVKIDGSYIIEKIGKAS